MRVLKYFFLLFLLLFTAVVIFVATSDSTYTLTRTKFINSPKSVVFKFVEDFSLWRIWYLRDDPTMSFSDASSPTNRPTLQWSGDAGEGSIENVFLKSTDNINQKIILNDAFADSYWTFKDTAGGSIVTWKIVGELSFKDKFSVALHGSAENIVDRMYERSMISLQRVVNNEVRNYKIRIEGIDSIPETYYICKSMLSSRENLPRNIRVLMNKLDHFVKKNGVITSGDPFVLYENIGNIDGDVATIKVGIPVPNQIHTTEGSEILSGHLVGVKSVKTTLFGDYSHLSQANSATRTYISKYTLPFDSQSPVIVYYRRRAPYENLPSKWITEIHYALKKPQPRLALKKITVPAIRAAKPAISNTTDEFDL